MRGKQHWKEANQVPLPALIKDVTFHLYNYLNNLNNDIFILIRALRLQERKEEEEQAKEGRSQERKMQTMEKGRLKDTEGKERKQC